MAKGHSVRAITNNIGRDRTTIYRELHRLKTDRTSYSPTCAQADAEAKQKTRREGKTKLTDEHWEWIETKLQNRWSPETISNYLKNCNSNHFQISHESIYQYIYSQKGEKKKKLIAYLRQKKKARRRRKSSLERRGKIKNATSIHERPEEVQNREAFGHWEGDLIIGKDHKTAIGTLVERKSRFLKIIPLPKGKDSLAVVTSFAEALSGMPPGFIKSMTYDRGQEMASHDIFTMLTGAKVYFADPRSPWQRGTNENTNGLIRDFFPKKTDFSEYSSDDFERVEALLKRPP